jgi:hypothetical protein
VTEAKWLASTEPSLMLLHLEGKVSERKLRLYSCACWRNVWELLNREDHDLIEANEDFADQGRTLVAKLFTGVRIETRHVNFSPSPSVSGVGEEVAEARSVAGAAACEGAVSEAVERSLWRHARRREGRRQCDLLRCVVGNPFRPVSIPDDVRAWNDGALVKMARAIYDGRRWVEMPILADALEDAGCTDVVLLDHCRTPNPHARGCHVLDALLSRN